MTQVTIRLFGAFRSLSSSREIPLEVSTGTTAQDIKHALSLALPHAPVGLIESAALADETHILAPSETVVSGTRLAILPPVCGG